MHGASRRARAAPTALVDTRSQKPRSSQARRYLVQQCSVEYPPFVARRHGRWRAELQTGPVVAFDDAAVVFGQRTVWSHANLTLAAGEFVGLIGPNGTGKSTLLRVLLGQVPLAGGQVRVLATRRGVEIRPLATCPSVGPWPRTWRIRGFDLVMLGLVGDRWGFGRPLPPNGRPSKRPSRPLVRPPTRTAPWACCRGASSSGCRLPRRC